MKTCPKCELDKNLNEFGKDKQKSDGLNSYCKTCIRKRSLQQRRNNPEYDKKYAEEYRNLNRELLRLKSNVGYYRNRDRRLKENRENYQKHKHEIAIKRAKKRRTDEFKEKNRIRQSKWRSENSLSPGEYSSKWKKENPEKSNAHALVLFAVKTGILKRSDNCEDCGKKSKTEGHHEDYSKPLDVQWLCKGCHAKKHQIYR